MVIEVLVREQILEGKLLLEALRAADFPVSAAFWERLPDAGYWQLIIASELARVKGPIEAYAALKHIWDTLSLQSVRFTDITVLSPTDFNYIRYHKELPYRRGSNPRDLPVDSGYIYFIDQEAAPRRSSNGLED